MKSIDLRDVSKRYGRDSALIRIGATFSAGQISFLIGANGAGKSTLLSILSGQAKPSSGTITHRRGNASAERSSFSVGLMAHQDLLYAELEVEENLLFFARSRGYPRARDVVACWIIKAGLEEVASSRVGRLSHGMRRRVSFCSAMLHRPDLVLLDEPLSGLDRSGISFIKGEMERARSEGGIVVATTHDGDMIADLADQVVVLDRGMVSSVVAGPSCRSREMRRALKRIDVLDY